MYAYFKLGTGDERIRQNSDEQLKHDSIVSGTAQEIDIHGFGGVSSRMKMNRGVRVRRSNHSIFMQTCRVLRLSIRHY